jgi:hypothetical protein
VAYPPTSSAAALEPAPAETEGAEENYSRVSEKALSIPPSATAESPVLAASAHQDQAGDLAATVEVTLEVVEQAQEACLGSS